MLSRIGGSSPLTRGKHGPAGAGGAGGGLIPAHAGKTARGGEHASQRRAHPRSRGENVVTVPRQAGKSGSSPLTRGKRVKTDDGLTLERLIPAHAGKTSKRVHWGRHPGAHPRSRGENSAKGGHMGRQSGSSPLTRGKRVGVSDVGDGGGLIPAHAGKTFYRPFRDSHIRAHPRSRGENIVQTARDVEKTGSSPLTRGKQRGHLDERHPPGLIPAHAGKTTRTPSSRLAWCGSSPLTRGKLLHPRRGHGREGLIPAHAGKTHSPRRPRWWRRAHPRSRGENALDARRLTWEGGSSPLTRGKRSRAGLDERFRGLIPAHAGKTHSTCRTAPGQRAHPRSRGENQAATCDQGPPAGSSPLTRGKHSISF